MPHLQKFVLIWAIRLPVIAEASCAICMQFTDSIVSISGVEAVKPNQMRYLGNYF
jgi:hypothetical protein